MEEYVYVLDYLPNGNSNVRGVREPIVYAIGEAEFKLFELVAKPNINVQFGDRIYIGQEIQKRTVIDHVKRKIKYTDLSATAQGELEYTINTIVMADQQRFLRFYNKSESLSLKKHALEELPGLGKKTMVAILEQRKVKEFESFEDLATRVPLNQPEQYIVKRIIEEISEDDHKHYFFVPRERPRRDNDRPPRRQ